MPIVPFTALACPLDAAPLVREKTGWCCANGHHFDIASQGYVNLLPVQQKRSRDPGDSKEMVAARRRFLTAGHYQPIAAAVSAACLADLPATGVASCLDAGCGEGYYLRELASCIDSPRTLSILGLDISKWAVLAAAKQAADTNWIVASNAHLPVLSATLDRVLCLFGFPVYPEFFRVLKPGGQLLQVDAGPDHLRELREIIYPRLKPERIAESTPPAGFSQLNSDSLRFSFTLEGKEAVADLLTMTPHLYRASSEGKARAAALDRLALTADVRLTRWQRNAAR